MVAEGVAAAAPKTPSEPSGTTTQSDDTSATDEDTAEPGIDDADEDAEDDPADEDGPADEDDEVDADDGGSTGYGTVSDDDDDDDDAADDDAADDDEPAVHHTEQADLTEDADLGEDPDAGVGAEPPTVAEPAAPEPRADTAPVALTPRRAATPPVTATSIATDLLTWVGLRPLADRLPVPATPVPGLVESLWLAVRHTQYLINNQRPVAAPTVSGPGPQGVTTGNLNAVDYDDASLTYTVVAAPMHGRVVVDATGEFTYVARVAGRADRFTVAVDDRAGNPFHVHGLAGLLGLSGPTHVVVTVEGAPVVPAAPNPTAREGVGDQLVSSAADAALVLNAMAPALGATPGFAGAEHIRVDRAGDGGTAENFYRYSETVGGVSVLGSDIILVTDASGTVTGLFNNYIGVGDDFDVTPDDALDEAGEVGLVAGAAYLGADADADALAEFLAQNTVVSTLVVYALDGDVDPALAWRADVQFRDTGDLSPSSVTYVIDADGENVGTVLVTSSPMHRHSVTGIAVDRLGDPRTINVDRGGFFFPTYTMFDITRNIKTYSTTYSWFGLGGPLLPGSIVQPGWSGWNSGAVSAHANTAVVYDYYRDVLGRTSFDGEGAVVRTSIRYNPVNLLFSPGYANAFWDPTRQQFAYGNSGSLQAALDVVAHEYTHAVVSYVVGDGGSVLDHGESGALNEAFADILGLLVEGKAGPERWLIGEDSSYGIVRNLADPDSVQTAFGPHSDHYDSAYTGDADDGGEHLNSTIFSHAAYLMMTDAATAGVTDERWARVFYHSLFRLSEGALFADGRAAVLDTADQQGFTPAQLQAIRAAFDAVGIDDAAPSAILA
ncbi:MAG: M4 family metallopeptidase [Actinomycetota bacterium]|nr:M4 family metallopeptidase [Actinomycetota bacterium]